MKLSYAISLQAEVRHLRGELDEALEMHRASLEIRQELLGAVVAYVQSGIVYAEVLHAGEHPHATLAQAQAVHPAGGLAEVLAGLAGLALQQPDLARQRFGFRSHVLHAAAGGQR